MMMVIKMNKKYRGIATYTSVLKTQIDDFLKSRLREISNNEIIPSYGSLLSIVYKNGGSIQIKELYDTILKPKSTITDMINKLVDLGYLSKEVCCEDKRVTYVTATEKASKFKTDFDKISDELVDKIFNDFTENEKEQLAMLMKKAMKNFL